MTNTILKTDTYKVFGHWRMAPDFVQGVEAYLSARMGAEFPYTISFGLQRLMMDHLEGPQVTHDMVDEAMEIAFEHVGNPHAVNEKGWRYIVDKLGGHLPIEIHAVPEGMKVPINNATMKIMATDRNFPSLGQQLESLLMHTWYPTTVATAAHATVGIIKKYIDQTSDNNTFWLFALHDFGFRAATCLEQANIGGSAILTATMGTDTVSAYPDLKKYYGASYKGLAYSCPASEHFIPMCYGQDNENKYLLDLMQSNKDGLLSVVGDTYDIETFVENVVCGNKDAIIARHESSDNPLTKVVVRPDSPRFEGDTPAQQVLWIIQKLASTFGTIENSKGYNTLHPSVGCIYGDSLTRAQIYSIYETLEANLFDCSCCVVGQGGGLMQKLNRDTNRFAIKPSAIKTEEGWQDVVKNPRDKSKKSMSGRLKLVNELQADGSTIMKTINQNYPLYHDMRDIMVPVFRNGEILQKWSFEEIRQRTMNHG